MLVEVGVATEGGRAGCGIRWELGNLEKECLEKECGYWGNVASIGLICCVL